jgi:hypothetical protein
MTVPGPVQCANVRAELEALDANLKTILPAQYHECYEDVLPISMGSAALKTGPDGRVAWDEVWTTFCDLALAGGPPHRGTLLQPATSDEVLANPEEYQQVVAELGRGIYMVTGLGVQTYPAPGWIGVRCLGVGMAGWLVRAIVAENVTARHEGETLYLPTGPAFQLAKEIKNVVTVIAKTCHYWLDHTPASQQESIAALLVGNSPDQELVEPASIEEMRRASAQYQAVVDELTNGIAERLGWSSLRDRYVGWVGVACPDEATAVWLMRAMIVKNILARREGNLLFVPASPRFAGDRCKRLLGRLVDAQSLWVERLRQKAASPDSTSVAETQDGMTGP